MANPHSKTHKQFVDEVRKAHPNLLVNSTYTGARQPVDLECTTCGGAWVAPNAGKIISSYYKTHYPNHCPQCLETTRGYHRRPKKANTTFIQELAEISPQIKVLGTYVTSHTKIKCQCLVCQNIWGITPTNLLSGKGCPACSRESLFASRRISERAFYRRVGRLRTPIKILSHIDFDASRSGFDQDIKCQCGKCNHVWSTTPYRLLNSKYGCPSCASLTTGYARTTYTTHGRKFHVQGNEPQAIDWMIGQKGIQVQDIKYGSQVPSFDYYDSYQEKQRTYRPDFYLEDQNRIIEVKSNYTLMGKREWLQNVRDKRQAVIKAGFKFSLLVFGKHGELLEIPSSWHTRLSQVERKRIMSS